jgi:gamma-glutamyltranspeptidase/glutathione hydrolase
MFDRFFRRPEGRQRGRLATVVLITLLAAWLPEFAIAGGSLGVPGTRGGVVTTSEPNGAAAGAEILRQGGNAVDAALAAAFALNVVEPQSAGIGGGGFMVFYQARSGRTVTLDTRESAPANATPDMFVPFLSAGGFAEASTSGLAVGVPGMVRGAELALERWGNLSLAEVLAPAIRLAEEGFRVGPNLADSLVSDRLQSEIGHPAYDEARKVFFPGGEPLQAGVLLIQPDLAKTLKLLATLGADAFYTGDLAAAIVSTQLATRGGRSEGIGRMTLADLADYRARVRDPVVGKYRGYTLYGMGPPSSGGLTVFQILKMMQRFPIGNSDLGYGFGSTRTLHVMVEAMRLAFADRAVWMGDDDFVPVPVVGLLNNRYVRMRSALIDPDARQLEAVADDPRPFDPAFANPRTRLSKPAEELKKGLNTTHFSVVDYAGNVVSYTNTVESAWGTGLMVPGYGFLLNNELTDFNFAPTFNPDPDDYNPGANDVAPGKRPRSSMSPVIVFQGRHPVAGYGSPGGSTIINSVLNTTLNLIDHRLNVQEAVDAPRISQTSANGTVSREIGFDEQAIDGLTALGHSVNEPSEIGSVQAVVIERPSGLQYGAGDRRRVGAAVSVERREIQRH